MACASCGTPVVMASELLAEQTARLERKVRLRVRVRVRVTCSPNPNPNPNPNPTQVYPYELDFLDQEDVWCYPAIDPSLTLA